MLDDFDEGVDGDNDSIDDIFNVVNSMLKDNFELKVLVDEVDGKLKKIVLFFNVFIK